MNPSAVKHAMYYGLLLGVVFIANFLMQSVNGLVFNILHVVVIFIIPYLVFCISRHCRRYVYNDVMLYGQALWYDIQLFFYAAMVSSAFKFIYFKYLNPTFLKNTLNQSIMLLEQMKVTLTDEMISMTEIMLTPLNMALQYIWIDVFFGIIVSLFVAAFVKKEKNVL